jgi:hypothetical protein
MARTIVWYLIALLLLVIALALSPTLASVLVALVFVAILVWRTALLC